MSYVALKPIKVGTAIVKQETVLNGTVVEVDVEVPVIRQPGEAIPEADSWPDPSSYISQGLIQYVPDEMIALVAKVDQLQAEVRELKANTHTHKSKSQ